MSFTEIIKRQVAGLAEPGCENRHTAAHFHWSCSSVQRYAAEFKKNGKFHINTNNLCQKYRTKNQIDRLSVRSVQGSSDQCRNTFEHTVKTLSTGVF